MFFENQLLSARLEIREYFLNRAVRSIYDNIGQMLSLAMVNLSLLETKSGKERSDLNAQTKQVLGQSIRDLRAMAAQFSPENNLATTADFVRHVQQEIQDHFPGARWKTEDKEQTPEWFPQGYLLLAFSIILILIDTFIGQGHSPLKEVNMEVQEFGVDITFIYEANLLLEVPFMVEKRIQMLNGKVQYDSADRTSKSITLYIPLYNPS